MALSETVSEIQRDIVENRVGHGHKIWNELKHLKLITVVSSAYYVPFGVSMIDDQ